MFYLTKFNFRLGTYHTEKDDHYARRGWVQCIPKIRVPGIFLLLLLLLILQR